MKSRTSAYLDDIFVDEKVVGLDYVKRDNDEVLVFRLYVRKVGNKLVWS